MYSPSFPPGLTFPCAIHLLHVCRLTWRDDGKRLASVSDDRTVRVWNVEHQSSFACFGGEDAICAESCDDLSKNVSRVESCDNLSGSKVGKDGSHGSNIRRLVLTGWGHLSRVWDARFTRLGVVTCGEVRCHNVTASNEPKYRRMWKLVRLFLLGFRRVQAQSRSSSRRRFLSYGTKATHRQFVAISS